MATKIFIVTVFPKKLRLSEVRLGKRPRLTDFGEAEWNDQTVGDVVESLKQDFGVSRARLLLTAGLDFVVKLEVPKGKENLRQVVAEILEKKKPEVLAAGDWDFRVTGETERFLKVMVFAPERALWQKFAGAFRKAKITIEAVEPEILAKQRDDIAEIGLALKTDLGGWDAETLNVVPAEVEKEPAKRQEKKGASGSKVPWVWGGLGGVILLGLTIGGVVVSQRALESRPTPTPTPSGEVVPAATEAAALDLLEASPSAEPEVREVDLAKYGVQVLNGSGRAGVASKVGLLLEAVGFEEIAVGNADAATYELTRVQRKEAVADEVVEAVIKALSESYEVAETEDFLDEAGTYDVVVMVGKET